MKKLAISSLMVLLSLSLSFSLNAQAAFRIGCNDMPPYSFSLDDGTITGLATELVEGVFKAMGIGDYEIKVFPWARSLRMLTAGTLHAVYTMQKNKDREILFYYPQEPLTYSKWVFFIQKDNIGKLKFDSLDDLKGKQIGLVRDYKYTSALWEFVKKENNYQIVSAEELNFKKLAAGRVDYVISEYNIGKYLAEKMGISDKVVALENTPIESASPIYIVFSKKTVKKEFVDKFSNELNRLKAAKYE